MEALLVQAFSQGLSIQSAVDRNSNWVSLGGGPLKPGQSRNGVT